MPKKVKAVNFLMELLLYAVIFVPMVFFGGVEPWAKALAHGLVVLLLVLYVVKSLMVKKFAFFSFRSNIPAFFFLACVLLSTVFSVYLEDSLRSLVVFVDALSIFAISASLDRDRKNYERVLYVLLIIGSFHALYAIYEPLVLEMERTKWHITGTFFNHNHFAAFIELLFFIPVLFICFKKDFSWKKYPLWLSMAVFTVALVLALSRGAIMSVILTFAVFSLLIFKRRVKILVAGTLFFCP